VSGGIIENIVIQLAPLLCQANPTITTTVQGEGLHATEVVQAERRAIMKMSRGVAANNSRKVLNMSDAGADVNDFEFIVVLVMMLFPYKGDEYLSPII